ncbi:pol polyprotein [Tanacetum coccineum]
MVEPHAEGKPGRAVDNGHKLYMGNFATANIKGEGDVVLKMTSEKELKLTNVLYVPEILYVGKGYAMNDMFKLNVMVVKNEINKMNSSAYLIESSNVWHARLGHVVQSDRGGEYVSPFAEVCAPHGIRHEFTAPYSPQQNGIAERKNRTLKEMVTAMLISSETGILARLDDEVVQNKRQRDDNDLSDERQDQTEEEEVEPRRSKRARNGNVWTEFFHQMDVKTAFLNGDLEEEIYMNQPEGFIAPGQEGKDTSSGYVILCLYVDDMLIVGSNDKMIKSTKDMLKSKFDMKDMGLADVILGIKIIRTQNGLVLSQAHYVDKILNAHNAGYSGQARTPIDIIGVLRSPRRELRNELKYVQSGVKMNEISCLKSVFCNGPWMICGIPILLNKWSPSMSLLKEELTHVPVLVKFHDVPLVAYTSDGLSLMATKIGTPMMLDSYTNSKLMVVPNLKGNGYTKETIRIEYEWEPPRCSTCLIFGHSPIDCPIVTPKRVVNQKDKGKGQTLGADDESFIEVKKKKSVGNNDGTKNFTISVNTKTEYRPKAKQSSEAPKTTPFDGTNKASTSGYNKESLSNKGNTFSFSNSFKALNDENLVIEEVATGSMATTSANLGYDDEVEPINNEMESFLASKPMGVGFGPKSLLKQWRESNDYDPYNDDMYEGQEISDNIQTICDNLDIKEGYEFENTCNNDKNLSEIQLEHEKEDELVAVVEIENGLLEEVEVSLFGKNVMILEWMSCFSITCSYRFLVFYESLDGVSSMALVVRE